MLGISTLTIVLVASLSFAGIGRATANLKPAPPFNPSGDYHPVNSPRPESMKFAHFDLEVRRRKGKLVAWGDVRNVGTHYKFASVSITEKTLKFTTVIIRGVSYSFDGRFLGAGDFPSQFTGSGVIMLEGTLTKLERGKKAAEVTSPFLYYPGC